MSDIPPGRIEMEILGEYLSSVGEEIGQKDKPQEPTTETASILLLPIVLKTIEKLGSCADLEALRQVNEDCHEVFGSACCDIVNPVMDFGHGTQVSIENWTPKIAHIYRTFNLFADYLGQKPKFNTSGFNRIIPHVTPYITTIRLHYHQVKEVTTGAEYSNFLNEFTNLKNIQIRCPRPHAYNYWNPKIPGPTDQLAIGLENLKTKPKIHFTLIEYDHREMILDKFATKENTTFEIGIGWEEYMLPWVSLFKFEEFQNICTKFGHLKNISYTINNVDLPFHLFQIFTNLCIQIGTQIDKLSLVLAENKASWFQEGINQWDIRNCLDQLSPFVTHLKLCQPHPQDSTMDYPWNILLHDIKWPKLKNLSIRRYKSPLNILKNCTNLEYLRLEIDQNQCIFFNDQKSDKECLDEYFGHLDQLKELYFDLIKEEDKIYEGNELDQYLTGILPKLKQISHFKLTTYLLMNPQMEDMYAL